MIDPPSRPRRSQRKRLPAPLEGRAVIPGFEGVRLSIEQAESSLRAAADHLALPRAPWSREDFNILAISGGAAGGAFGAGVLVGLTQAGTRPNFAIVTGVSTGALMAPFAFLGSAWDDRLTEAYTGGRAAQLLSFRRLGPALGEGVFRAEALEALIDPFVDEALLADIAREHALGRRLLVATTDLDSQTSCIWDMGTIAAKGGPAAVTLFRNILAASASLPGLFPPRRFLCERDGEAFEEMHTDGGVASPLFIMPEALLRWRSLGRRLHRSQVYVIVNTVLEPHGRTTQPNVAAILIRSFDTMLRFSYRHALSTAAAFCEHHHLPFNIASIPDKPEHGSMLSFDTASMQRMFDAGLAAAHGGELWAKPSPQPPTWAGLFDRLRLPSASD